MAAIISLKSDHVSLLSNSLPKGCMWVYTSLDCRVKKKKGRLKKQVFISNAKERSRSTSGTVCGPTLENENFASYEGICDAESSCSDFINHYSKFYFSLDFPRINCDNKFTSVVGKERERGHGAHFLEYHFLDDKGHLTDIKGQTGRFYTLAEKWVAIFFGRPVK